MNEALNRRGSLTNRFFYLSATLITVLTLLGPYGCTNQAANTPTNEIAVSPTTTFKVTGEVRGLDGNLVSSPLEIVLNNETLSFSESKSFQFNQPFRSGDAFKLQIAKQPGNAHCPIKDEFFIVANSNVNIVIDCYASKQKFTVTVPKLFAPVALHIAENQQLITEPGVYSLEVYKRHNHQYPIELIDPYQEQLCNVPLETQSLDSAQEFNLAVVCTKNDKEIAFYEW